MPLRAPPHRPSPLRSEALLPPAWAAPPPRRRAGPLGRPCRGSRAPLRRRRLGAVRWAAPGAIPSRGSHRHPPLSLPLPSSCWPGRDVQPRAGRRRGVPRLGNTCGRGATPAPASARCRSASPARGCAWRPSSCSSEMRDLGLPPCLWNSYLCLDAASLPREPPPPLSSRAAGTLRRTSVRPRGERAAGGAQPGPAGPLRAGGPPGGGGRSPAPHSVPGSAAGHRLLQALELQHPRGPPAPARDECPTRGFCSLGKSNIRALILFSVSLK